MRVLLLLGFLTACSSTPDTLGKRPVGDVDRYWEAAYETALDYPLEDVSKMEGFIESEWISSKEISNPEETRYRFFITIEKESTPPVQVYVQSQKKLGSGWQWQMPSLNIKEKIERSIYAKVKNKES